MMTSVSFLTIHTSKKFTRAEGKRVLYLRVRNVDTVIFVFDSWHVIKANCSANCARCADGEPSSVCVISKTCGASRRNQFIMWGCILHTTWCQVWTCTRHQHVPIAAWRVGKSGVAGIVLHGWHVYWRQYMAVRYKVWIVWDLNWRVYLCNRLLLYWLLNHGWDGQRVTAYIMWAQNLQQKVLLQSNL